ncbi:MAG: DEAD/DEAH box helicase [Nitrospira sp.]|nr:MAG: DEAD/DEAH box helicase [Nitrospira sp.]
MSSIGDRPEFRKTKSVLTYSSPEELFSKLPNRVGTHGYLRIQQADVLREYTALTNSDIALELPTGTGKTAVGLLIAEWRRRKSAEKVAYLVLTNQLAKQVMQEAHNLGIPYADLTGTRETRDPAEVGKYNLAKAVAVSTYSNLFNVNPVIQASDVLVLDDAHGAESFVSGMWSVRIRKDSQRRLYREVLTALRTSLTDVQFRVVSDEDEFEAVEVADIHSRTGVGVTLTTILDEQKEPEVHFPWGLIRNHLHACLCLVSSREIVIRPLVPPTHTHAPFADTNQRIYMSATLSGEGDLQRSYGITEIMPVRAKHADWGKRYIFVPGLSGTEGECFNLISEIWKRMESQRGVILAPSFVIADRAFDQSVVAIRPKPQKFTAADIEESLKLFTANPCAILCLAGRYDGIDLPGDACRLLIICETPAGIDALERHLRDHWKMGPMLRRRERTRLIQGMGRCTRDATDFAVVIMLGQSLLNSLTTKTLTQGFPEEIQKELNWGMEQSDLMRENRHQLSDMIIGLLTDADYRKRANESLEDAQINVKEYSDDSYNEGALAEVNYERALWDGDFSHALKIAREQADHTNHPELTGYRAWWWYLASVAAGHLGDSGSEIDCLKRARATRINTGYLDHLLRARNRISAHNDPADQDDIQAEDVWGFLEKYGWQGPRFKRKLDEMLEGLSRPAEPTKFNIGLETLGECFGATVFRPTDDGAPDVVWLFHDSCYAIENKSDKKPENSLSKKEVLQAKGHVEWVRANVPEAKEITIRPVIVAEGQAAVVAEPHLTGVFHVFLKVITAEGERLADELATVRAEFAGKEYGAVQADFRAMLKSCKLDRKAVDSLFSKPLIVEPG